MPAELASSVAASLPYLRRYARALTGNQARGDFFAASSIENMMENISEARNASSPVVALFRSFHQVWTGAGAPVEVPRTGLAARAEEHMARLTPKSREALLLSAVEGFEPAEIGEILDVSAEMAAGLIARAHQEMQSSLAGRVMIIEDEAIIAMDIQEIVTESGHSVTGIARTRDEAVALARRVRPDLILADIQLADRSSGIDAVNEIAGWVPDLPVIFLTAFPERLLTGERPEPAFLITKPFSEDQVRSAVSQAMFFASTDTLGG